MTRLGSPGEPGVLLGVPRSKIRYAQLSFHSKRQRKAEIDLNSEIFEWSHHAMAI
jgi:hypothetical protein